MLRSIHRDQSLHGSVSLRTHLQAAALNNILWSVFGKRFGALDCELEEVRGLVREGFEVLGAFNFCDYLPWLSWFYDPSRINQRCAELVPRVNRFVRGVIDEHRRRRILKTTDDEDSDFVDVLLSLNGDEKLHDDDMVAVLWVQIKPPPFYLLFGPSTFKKGTNLNFCAGNDFQRDGYDGAADGVGDGGIGFAQ